MLSGAVTAVAQAGAAFVAKHNAILDWDPVGDELVVVFGDAERTEPVYLAEGLVLVFDQDVSGRCVTVLAADASLLRGRRARLLRAVLGSTVHDAWLAHRSTQQLAAEVPVAVSEPEWTLLTAVWRSLQPVHPGRRSHDVEAASVLAGDLRHWIDGTRGAQADREDSGSSTSGQR